MKVQIGEHIHKLPTFRVGYLKYFSVQDLIRLEATESPEVLREWMPAVYADNLVRDLIAPDTPDGSVYLAQALPERLPSEDCIVMDEDLFYRVAYVCSRHFCLLKHPALNAESVRQSISRHAPISLVILNAQTG